jgi:transposase
VSVESEQKLLTIKPEELAAIVEKTRTGALEAGEFAKLKCATDTLVFLQSALQSRNISLERLTRMLFGPSTERTPDVVKGKRGRRGERRAEGAKTEKAHGHGRNGAAAYTGAERIKVPHATLHGGACCPECQSGKVYPVEAPAALVRIQGVAPLSATVWECDRLRCNLCGEVYTAEAPDGVGTEKYDETAVAMTGLLSYGTGVPFNRLEVLQGGMGIPLPAATQWDLVNAASQKLEPLYEELVTQAAQGEVLHNDDTTMKVLDLTKEQVEGASAADESQPRVGVFTSGVISTKGERAIALFFTGHQHAGENLADVLAKRKVELATPIQMCDALAANTAGDFTTIVANCLAHARRGFIDVVTDFPTETQLVLETLREVYRCDADAKQRGLNDTARLELHQAQSGPRMAALKSWLDAQMEQRLVEPNSGLGQAIRYMRKHWEKLTRFLQKAGAPLDNNRAERALKKAILHRRNSLFYRTLNGARVGDIFMSLIHTAELSGEQPFEYLVAMLRNHEAAKVEPGAWMPWSFRATLAQLAASTE